MPTRGIAEAVGALDPTDEERAAARRALLDVLAVPRSDPRVAFWAADAVAALGPTAQDRAAARRALRVTLAAVTDAGTASAVAELIAALDPTAEDQAAARQALLAILAAEKEPHLALALSKALAGLGVTVADLDGCEGWPLGPGAMLLAAARRNSGLTEWLAALPTISGIARARSSPDTAPTVHG
jgi:hypothetical protein